MDDLVVGEDARVITVVATRSQDGWALRVVPDEDLDPWSIEGMLRGAHAWAMECLEEFSLIEAEEELGDENEDE